MTVADDTTEDHGHHLPAVKDFPRGFGEASWWPFITAVGGSGFYIGAALYVMAQRDLFGSTTLGGGIFVASTALFLVGLYGWLYHAFVSDFWNREADHHNETKLRWGMLTFLGSEIATFGALFVYYFFIRAGGLGEIGIHLTGWLVFANTAILIASSFTMHYAHVALLNENRRRFVALLGTTFGLGVIFLGGQVYEYYEFLVHENFGVLEGAFNNGFYALTGLHGLHVSMGAVLLGIVFGRSLLGQYSSERHVSVSTVSMYWHFVDVVWVFLVVVLYVGASL